jgi:hypothetical protein
MQNPFNRFPNKPWPKVPEKDLGKVTCPKCKMIWEGVMGYVCSHNDCPIQPKAIS